MGSKPPKAKKIMLDFDECFNFVIITSQVQKRVHSGKTPGSFGLVEEQEGAVSDAGETGLSGESVTMQLFLKDNLEL
jgi:hypothetical protein